MKNTKVILNQDVYNLGEEGDVREVASGYARNFLIPQGLAAQYTKQNLDLFEQRREKIEQRKDEKRQTAMGLKEQIESKMIELEMPAGNNGKLFGSVNSATIAERLTAVGIMVERKKIDVPDSSIKMTGEHTVRVRLYGDEVAELRVVVNPVGGKKVLEAKREAAEASERGREKAAAKQEEQVQAEAAETSAEDTEPQGLGAKEIPAETEAAAESASEGPVGEKESEKN